MTEIVRIERVDIAYEPQPWPFAMEREGEIERHFAERRRERPGMWNGRVLLLHQHRFVGAELRGRCFQTDYASFTAWRDWNFPDRQVINYFAGAVLRTSDGGYMLGEMGAHTAAAGWSYFPCGTPEPGDLVGCRIDLEGSLRREFTEETGLNLDDFAAEPGWTALIDGPYIALMKMLQARESGDEIGARVRRYLAREREPELAGVRIVHGPADLAPPIPAYVTDFLAHAWGGGSWMPAPKGPP
jgi:hypothetical protein